LKYTKQILKQNSVGAMFASEYYFSTINMSNITIGQKMPFKQVISIDGETVRFEGGSGLIHLQLRRFSGVQFAIHTFGPSLEN
jgi:hypothetical protein